MVVRIRRRRGRLYHVSSLELQEHALARTEQDLRHKSELSDRFDDVDDVQLPLQLLVASMVDVVPPVEGGLLREVLGSLAEADAPENVVEDLRITINESRSQQDEGEHLLQVVLLHHLCGCDLRYHLL